MTFTIDRKHFWFLLSAVRWGVWLQWGIGKWHGEIETYWGDV